MVLIVDAAQAFAADVRIDLRGCDAGVTQHLLDLTQVGASGQ